MPTKFVLSLLLLLLTAPLSLYPEELKPADIRNTMEELFSYHIEYKELTPLVVKRSFKVAIEQFDPWGIYLTQSEVTPFLELSQKKIESIIDQYAIDSYTSYEELMRLFSSAVKRSRLMRQEIAQELLARQEFKKSNLQEDSSPFAKGEGQLKERIQAQMEAMIASEEGASLWRNKENRVKLLALIENRFNRFERKYVECEQQMPLHVLKAMARSLDAHTDFYTPNEAFEIRASLEKQFEGVGVILKEGVEGVEIAGLAKNSPAEKSGQIQVGDVLAEIDGASTMGLQYEEVLERLKNDRGSISLGVRRGNELVRVALKKEKIVMEDERLSYAFEPFMNGIIGKITLPSFYESFDAPSCEADLKVALRELRKEGKILGLVIDLRENLGGFLNQAVKVASLFMTSGVVSVSKYSQGEIQYMRHVDPRVYYQGPLVILTSKTSASAAEIVAQALQDYGIALVLGDERTYGKGSIQFQTLTDAEAASFFKVTVGKYYTVSGRTTQIEGVKGDVLVPTSYSPYNIGEKYLEYPLPRDHVPAMYADSLIGIDSGSKAWFQKNYLPYLQKKESRWVQMLTKLRANSEYRIKHDSAYQAFLKKLSPLTAPLPCHPDDLQMQEAVNVIKDMVALP